MFGTDNYSRFCVLLGVFWLQSSSRMQKHVIITFVHSALTSLITVHTLHLAQWVCGTTVLQPAGCIMITCKHPPPPPPPPAFCIYELFIYIDAMQCEAIEENYREA